MSEFACRNKHPMESDETKCKICGAKLTYVDGCTSREMDAMDNDSCEKFRYGWGAYYPEEEEE